MSEKKEKGFLLSSIENFWYYYKWPFLGGILIFFVVLGLAMNFSEAPKMSDVNILAVFARPLTTQEFEFQTNLEGVITDVDGDSEKNILTEGFYISESGNGDSDVISMNKFENAMAYANGDLVLLDGTNLERYKGKDFLEPLESYIDISKFSKEDLVYFGDKAVMVRLSDSAILKEKQFIIDNVYAGIMYIPDGREDLKARRENASLMVNEIYKK